MPAWKLTNMVGGSVTTEEGLHVPFGGSVIVNAITPAIAEAVEKKLLKPTPPLDDMSGKFSQATGTISTGKKVTGASSADSRG